MAATAARIARIRPNNTAVFVCDMQERFRSAIWNFDHVTSAGVKLLKAAKVLELPVYTTEQNPKALGATVAPLANLISELPPELGGDPSPQFHPKTRFSMVLADGSTEKWLKAAKADGGIKDVIIFGIESHVCVLQTTLDLLEKGYGVHVLADGVSSCNQAEISIAIARMRDAGATIMTSESVLFQLLVDAVHPKFKAISALIKEEKETTKNVVSALLAKY
ncbi:Isochorismatase hydrolase [Tilletiaria anomala UBC 951]|uniref:Isochorismatase hydrolase n=1 Tax=Tilletiaria anomala (strain ATCC 24038 / CBS 436.72 / UBC 951) TaxID=1037660 RepID=A0A066VMZ5_TILAU|nr:Isochorismatase hydrolase [Tilletiaria anomala UBC 951]KDN39930.1 Isochorismatase hydrolase [Tilletiaria anomala UBC 951]